jgi:hypothetical protein
MRPWDPAVILLTPIPLHSRCPMQRDRLWAQIVAFKAVLTTLSSTLFTYSSLFGIFSNCVSTRSNRDRNSFTHSSYNLWSPLSTKSCLPETPFLWISLSSFPSCLLSSSLCKAKFTVLQTVSSFPSHDPSLIVGNHTSFIQKDSKTNNSSTTRSPRLVAFMQEQSRPASQAVFPIWWLPDNWDGVTVGILWKIFPLLDFILLNRLLSVAFSQFSSTSKLEHSNKQRSNFPVS